MGKTRIDADDIFVLANQAPQAQAAVEQRAARIAVRTRRNLSRSGVAADVAVRKVQLPTGRAARDVMVTVKDEKDRRRAGRIVRRSAREVRR